MMLLGFLLDPEMIWSRFGHNQGWNGFMLLGLILETGKISYRLSHDLSLMLPRKDISCIMMLLICYS